MKLLLTAAACAGAMVIGAAHAQPSEPALEPFPSLTVTGVAELEVAPDQVMVRLGVVTEGNRDQSPQDVSEENAKRMSKVLRDLRGLGLEGAELQSTRIAIEPIQEWPRSGGAPRLVGHRARNEIRVKTTRLEMAGKIIQTALDAGATNVDGVQFGLADERTHRAAAIADAAKSARADAQALAGALGVSLVRIVRVDLDQPQFQQPRPMMMRALPDRSAAGLDSAPPIEAGRITLHARVTIIYEMGDVEVARAPEIDPETAMRLLESDEARAKGREGVPDAPRPGPEHSAES